jgi:hypothetical protein
MRQWSNAKASADNETMLWLRQKKDVILICALCVFFAFNNL